MHVVAAFYRFTPLPDPAGLKMPLARLCCAQGVKGTILLAGEGINGTVAGPRAGIDAALAHLRALPGCADLDVKESLSPSPPFSRLKVRLKREIVTLGRAEADPRRAVGRYVEPADWNALIQSPDVAVIDTRNVYETALGSFRGAVAPRTEAFSDFPEWWQANRDRFAGKRIAMFCTGGIRCEKASSWLLDQGVAEVLHLKGGILGYLAQTPEGESLWQGECYVFDERVSLDHGLRPGRHTLCRACGGPVAPEARHDSRYEPGVSCPACADLYSAADKARFRERERQTRLAAARGARHLGPEAQGNAAPGQ